jgi:hypothetical protein
VFQVRLKTVLSRHTREVQNLLVHLSFPVAADEEMGSFSAINLGLRRQGPGTRWERPTSILLASME